MTETVLGIIGIFIAMIGTLVGNATGAGAGGFVVPSIYICFGYDLAQSVALWNACTFVTATYRIFFSGITNEKHVEGNKPIIDFNSVLMFQPLLFIGIQMGFIVMEILAEGYKLIIFSALLIAMSGFSLRKAIIRYRNENKAKGQTKILVSSEKIEVAGLSPSTLELIKQDQSYFPIAKILLSLLSVCLLTICYLLFGSAKNKSLIGIKQCTWPYFTGIFLYICCLIIILYFSYSLVSEERKKKIEAGIEILPSEFEWTQPFIIKVALLAILSGFFSSSYGIGGAIILNMILIYKNVNPEVITNTTMLCLFYICLSTTIVYMITKTLQYDLWSILLVVLTLPATAIAHSWLKKILKKRSSYILFILWIALGISSCLVMVFGLYKAYYVEKRGDFWKMKSFCKK